MPKLPIPDKLQKSMFWIVIGVLSLMSVVVWWLGTSAVAKLRNDAIAEINASFGVIGGANPTANETTIAAMQKQAASRQTGMTDAWTRVFERQLKEPFWPEVQLDANGTVIKPGLPPEFVSVARTLPPAEWLPENRELLSEPLKEIYRNYAKRQIADLCQIVGSVHRIDERRAAPTNVGGRRDDASDAAQPGEIVVWPTASQQVAAQLLTFAEGTNPLTQDVIYAQGGVWIYQALFNIIKATNESVKESTPPKDLAHYNAPVKMIHEILIGEKFVVKEDEGARAGSSSAADEEQIPIPAVLRRAADQFVNERGKRLKGEELLALGNPRATDADPARSYAQYKLVPVYMRLEVDQRHLGRLLVECANSPMTLEVKDVSFKVVGHADRVAATTQDAGQDAGPQGKKDFYDMTVEITGHIYVYYPPPAAAPAPTDETPPEEPPVEDATAAAGG